MSNNALCLNKVHEKKIFKGFKVIEPLQNMAILTLTLNCGLDLHRTNSNMGSTHHPVMVNI